ncbi:hypothetical protein MNBD_NITROSPINAE03-1115 [hydrothermal vent metagenome]|uniref:Uncharacterized protein n=1 Tax=hydrothermal vent metagenome TaxID=652676 RepID=A0A3B1BIW7_9ZZZZ
MKSITAVIAGALAIAVVVSAPVSGQDEYVGVESLETKRNDETPYRNVILQQQKLIKKILDIQEQTLLLLKNPDDSKKQKEAQALLGKISKVKKETKQTDDEIEKVSKRPIDVGKGLQLEYTYTEDDYLAP